MAYPTQLLSTTFLKHIAHLPHTAQAARLLVDVAVPRLRVPEHVGAAAGRAGAVGGEVAEGVVPACARGCMAVGEVG